MRTAPRFAPRLAACLVAGACWLAAPAWALPTVDAVQAQIGQGNYSQAETMMAEVVGAKPGSARAHYLYAEILAHNQRFEAAAAELARAKTIDPAIKFTAPEKFHAFENMLDREQAAARRARSSPSATTGAVSSGLTGTQPAPQRAERAAPSTRAEPTPAPGPAVPGWAWALGGGAAAWLAWRLIAARRAPVLPAGAGPAGSYNMAASTAPAGNGFGGLAAPPQPAGYGVPQAAPGGWAAPGARSGLPGGMLGTGMAVAGGVAAGMLAERLFEGHRNSGSSSLASPGTAAGANAADGGLSSGLYPDNAATDTAARDLQQREIDVGTGDGWGGNDAGSDAGSDGGSDGGGW